MSVTFFAPGAPEDAEVNMSNANAAFVLDSLGPDTVELMGEEPAETFHGRILLALGIAPEDEGIPAHDDSQPGGPVWIECGRRPGYLQDRLSDLRTLATMAQASGSEICWG